MRKYILLVAVILLSNQSLFSQLPSYVPSNGLVAYYPFNGNANEEIGNANNGVVIGATLTADVNGNTNKAYSFNGVNNYINLPNNFYGGQTANVVSFSLRFKINSSGDYYIWNKDGSWLEAGIYTTANGAFGIFWAYPNQYNGIVTTNGSIVPNIWYEAVIIINGTNSKIFLNGVEQIGITINNPSNNIGFGDAGTCGVGINRFGFKKSSCSPGNYFNGILDEFMLFSRILTPQEISNLYTSCVSPAAPTGALTQTFCTSPAPTVASLTATGTGIQWYVTATGGTPLATTTTLVNGTTYYASQTVSACESTARLAVTAIINDPQISASTTTVCTGTSVTLTASSGVPSIFSVGSIGPSGGYVFYDQGSVLNGWRYLEAAPSDNGINDGIGCYCTTIPNTSTLIGTGKANTLNWINSGCNGAWLTTSSNIAINGNNNWFIPSKEEVNLMYTNLKLNNLGNFQNLQYWSSSPASYGSCGNNGGVWVQNYTNGNFVSEARNGYGGAGNLRLVRQFSTGMPFVTYLWSTGATTATINPTPTATTTYWCDVTVNGVTCRKTVAITVNSSTPTPTGALTQTFCATPAPTIASLTATGTSIQWYAAATGGTPLATTTALVNGTTYYASQTLNACESTTRLAVTVTLNDPQITASATTVCSGTPVTLSASTTATVAQNGNLPANLQTGLVGYWPFNGNANDASINGNNGTVNGATLTTDRFGNANSAYSFDGNNNIVFQSLFPFNQNSDASISIWINSNLPNNGSQGTFLKSRISSPDNNRFNFFINPNSNQLKLNFDYRESNVNIHVLNIDFIPISTWKHIVFVRNINSYSLFIDGLLSNIINDINPNLPTSIGWLLGDDPSGNSDFNGKLDDIAIYNRALSPSEITQLYTASPTYLWSTGETTATINPSPTATTTYWCDVTVNGVTCRKSVTINVNTTPAPTGALTQTFCAIPAPTIASLTATGTGIQWYAAATGGTPLATTTTLVNGTTYYASQTLNACESTTRLAVTVTLNDPQITASATTVCSGTQVNLSASTTATVAQNCNLPANLQTGLVGYWPFCGNANDVSGNGNNGTVNGATLTTDRFGNANSAYSFDGVDDFIQIQAPTFNNTISMSFWAFDEGGYPNSFSLNPRYISSEFCNGGFALINNVNTPGGIYFTRNRGNTSAELFASSSPTYQIYQHIVFTFDGDIGKFYINGNLINTVSNSGTISQSTNLFIGKSGCVFGQMIDAFKGKLDDIAIYNRTLTSTEVTQLFNTNSATYLWSTGETTATINPSPTATTTYWCDVTVNGVTCRKSVTINVNTTPAPTGALTQTFCATPAPTIASLTATGTGIQWYAAANGGTALATTTALVNGTTYYASQTLNACGSSTRLAVTVTLNDPQITASATTVCSGTPVTLSASATGNVAQNCNLPANLQTGLVGYWPFCGNANDVSGNANNGTVNGATLTTDRFGNANSAYSFDGISNYIDVTNAFFNNGWQDYTISLWFNANSTTATTFGGLTMLNTLPHQGLGVGFSYNNSQYIYHFKNSDPSISGTSWNIYANDSFNTFPINLNSWYNIGIVKNGNNYLYYLNGNLDKSTTANLSPISYLCSMRFGGITLGTTFEIFNGKLDDIAIYNRALSPAEIAQLYNSNQATYLWSTGATTPTINPSPTATTTYWCDVTVNGVTCRKSVTITVNPNITPTFTQVAPICNGATLAALPTTSTNNITGTWSPTINNTATTTYTFTPTAGQCATTATMTINVNPNITPTFTQVAPICNGATLAALPTTSTNNITGTWSPALNNTLTTTYTFTPTAGQCATTTTMTITVNPNITPTFTLVAPICNGATLAALPTTSTNNITGTWSPALDNTATTTYTFTPTAGLCATTATMTITVNPNVAPVFTQVAPICNGATLAALLTTSTNNITGTWSPALNNTATTTYTFTPTAGICATTATMTITVNPIVTPTFTQVAAICSGTDLSPLPTISTNGVNGTWSPALNNTATTTYTFTPISRQCATTTTMTITVNPNITPTFTQIAAICAGAPLAPLPTISNNGFTGTWSPALNNTATTTYTFTPTAGQCATTATMTITVNPLPLPPTGTITQTFCANIYPTLQNIVVNPTNVNWFSSLTSSTPLPITTNLPVGSTTYYASQFDAVTGCSSNGRLAVLATVLLENTPSTLTDQTFCSTDLKTLADLKTNGLNIVWYSSASGGTPLLGSYVLTSSQSLYAAIYNATTGCESPIRQMVQITIINCQLVANNLLTLNDNSLNDNLKIENIENFPINQIEIYNRFGELVWKTEYYNNDTNTFKGRANVSGVFQKDSDLPTGTYYFLLKYYDSYRGKYTDLKSFLYINNNN